MENKFSTLEYKDGKWMTCGCGGAAVRAVEVPPDSVLLAPVKVRYGHVAGVTGQLYQFLPNILAIDVHPDDAAHFIQTGQARRASESERDALKGMLSRREPSSVQRVTVEEQMEGAVHGD